MTKKNKNYKFNKVIFMCMISALKRFFFIEIIDLQLWIKKKLFTKIEIYSHEYSWAWIILKSTLKVTSAGCVCVCEKKS